MPISKYDKFFGGKGGAQKAYDAMIKEYGEEKGKKIFYATKNRNASKSSDAVHKEIKSRIKHKHRRKHGS